MSSRKKFPLIETIGFTVFVIAVILTFTNPDMEKFKKHFKKEMVSKVDDKSSLVGTLADLFEAPLWKFLEPYTSRQNYLVFSIYKIEFDNENFVYLGIWDHFYRLDD